MITVLEVPGTTGITNSAQPAIDRPWLIMLINSCLFFFSHFPPIFLSAFSIATKNQLHTPQANFQFTRI